MTVYRTIGSIEYQDCLDKMLAFTNERNEHTEDELWFLEHPPVYSQGVAGKAQHVLHPGNIPVIQSDRGGQVTYHGPGQCVAYTLFDLDRKKIGIRNFVCQLENIIIASLQSLDIKGEHREGAPGVYVAGEKIASIGLRVKHGRSYHGISLNVNMDLRPFEGINPCGFNNLKMTQIAAFDASISMERVQHLLMEQFKQAGW